MAGARLAVVVVSYNVCELLRCCLASLKRQEQDKMDIVVVDNASSDDSCQMVRDEFPEVTLLQNTTNEGFGAAVNAGAAASDSEFILLLNPDTELSQGAIAAMIASFGQGASRGSRPLGILGTRQVDAQGHFQLPAWWRPSLLSEGLRKFAQAGIDRKREGVRRAAEFSLRVGRRVAWVAGSCMLIDRQVFRVVGGFDTKFFLYFEDIDFCMRAGRAGFRVHYDPAISVLHHRGSSAAVDSVRAANAYKKSHMRFWNKHGSPIERRVMAWYRLMRGD